jgi:hypothetical protein
VFSQLARKQVSLAVKAMKRARNEKREGRGGEGRREERGHEHGTRFSRNRFIFLV